MKVAGTNPVPARGRLSVSRCAGRSYLVIELELDPDTARRVGALVADPVAYADLAQGLADAVDFCVSLDELRRLSLSRTRGREAA